MPLSKNARWRNVRWGLLILLGSFFLAACSDNAELVITNCSDQDYTPIGREVRITVADETKSWKPGERCKFEIPLEGKADKEVSVRADAGPLYFYNSTETMTVRKGKPTEVDLRFFRPYLITINVYDANNQPVENVDLLVEGKKIGATTVEGSYAWPIEQPLYLPGARIQIELNHNGIKGAADPVMLEKGKFDYTTSGKLTVSTSSIKTPERVLPPPPPSTPVYTIRIQAIGSQGQSLAGVKLTDETGAPIGYTNKNGSYTWQAKEPRVRVGSTINIELSKDGKTGSADPLRIVSGQFSYATRGQLDIEPPPKKTQPPRIEPETVAIPDIPKPAVYNPSPNLVQCSQLVDNGNFDDAITCLERIANPGADGAESQVKDYVNAQHLIGYLNWEKRGEYLQAVQAFQNILKVNPREWSAHYNLALVYYKTNAYVECRRECAMVIRLRHLIPVDKLNKAEPDVMFLKGLCQYRIYQEEPGADRIRKQQSGVLAVSELEDFVARARSLPAFQRQREEAQELIDEIENELRSLQ
jgi:hypothetical protein